MSMFNETSNTPVEAPESKGSGMKKLILGFTVLMILAAGVRFFLIYRERQDAAKPAAAAADPDYTDDQMVLPRQLHQFDVKAARELNGKRVWVFAAGQLNAFPATPTHMDYAHPGPLLLGAQPLDVVDFIEGKAPASAYSRVPKGDSQVFMLFHRAEDPAKLWGTPVGYKEGKFYTFFIDECFFYDDPHVLYKHWPAANWKAIDEHRVIKGMSEMQTNLALGQVSKPGAGSQGNRTIVFDNNAHPVTVTFVKDRATDIS
jgi:hypothetical protein